MAVYCHIIHLNIGKVSLIDMDKNAISIGKTKIVLVIIKMLTGLQVMYLMKKDMVELNEYINLIINI